MKRMLCLLLVLMLCGAWLLPASAAEEPMITRQPQMPTYSEYAVAEYAVTVYGENLRCKWFIHYDGQDYDMSQTGGTMKPWEPYAGETYGASTNVNGKETTFIYSFRGIGAELDGSYVYAVINDGHFEVTSDKAYISVADNIGAPPVTKVPAALEVFAGDVADLYCQATAPDGSTLSYLWYETSSGQLQDIIAINRGSEETDTLRVDTSECGTRYYLCAVFTSAGGSAYTSIIPVTVRERAGGDAPEITTASLPQATVGQPFSAKLQSTDADAEFSVYYNPGKANDFEKTGLTLTKQGTIEGVPTKEGSYTFTVCAAGENGEGYMTYTLQVVKAQAAPTTTTTVSTTQGGSDGTGVETEPTATAPSSGGKDQNGDGLAWWAIALLAVAAAGIGFGVSFFLLRKKA